MWPSSLETILEGYYEKQEKNNHKLTEEERKNLTKELICAYDALPSVDRGDMLVPERGEYLQETAIKKEYLEGKEYTLLYKWPQNEGFDGTWIWKTLCIGEEYDRIGGSDGKFLAPIIGGSVQTISDRAIPYHIPEKDIRKSPAYHKYTVAKLLGAKGDDVMYGKVAHAFNKSPKDGGGTQIAIPKRGRTVIRVITLIKEGILRENP